MPHVTASDRRATKKRTTVSPRLVLGGVLLAILALAVLLARTHVLQNVLGQADVKDGGFLSGEPCGPPCFLGITPNVTHEARAVAALQAEGLYSNCYIYNNEEKSGLRGAACSNVALAYFRGADIVGAVSFRPSERITVAMVVAKYGAPDAVSVSSLWLDGEQQPKTSMALLYNRLDASVSLGEQEGSQFIVSPATVIEGIGYSDRAFPSMEEHEAGTKPLSPWHAFGAYSDARKPSP